MYQTDPTTSMRAPAGYMAGQTPVPLPPDLLSFINSYAAPTRPPTSFDIPRTTQPHPGYALPRPDLPRQAYGVPRPALPRLVYGVPAPSLPRQTYSSPWLGGIGPDYFARLFGGLARSRRPF